MGKPVTFGQSHNLMGILANNTDWAALDGEVAQEIIDDPKGSGARFTAFLKNGGKVGSLVERTFPVWLSLMIGNATSSQLLGILHTHGFLVSERARDIMSQPAFTTLPESRVVSLIRLKVKNLGFTSWPTTKELFVRAKERGLDLCPAEVGAHLRLALENQPVGDCFWVAMEPITDSGGGPDVFRVERIECGEQWLRGGYAGPACRWGLESEIVFLLRSA